MNRPIVIFYRALVFAFIPIVVFAFSFTPLRTSTDEWWHLKTGKWITEHGELPENDIFAFTSENYRWDNHEWLTEVVMYEIYRWGEAREVEGVRAVIAAKSVVLVVTFALIFYLLWRRTNEWELSVLFTLIAAAVARRTFYPRPPVVTYFFVALFLLLLYAHREKRLSPYWLGVLAPLMTLWANLHGGFILGLVVLGLFLAGELIELIYFKFLSDSSLEIEGRGLWRHVGLYGILFVLCFVFSLLTPYGFRLYQLTYRVMHDTALVRVIGELLPPDVRYVWAYLTLIAFFVVAGPASRRKLFPAEALLFLFFFWQSSQHVRHLPLFALVTAAPAAWLATGLLELIPGGLRCWMRSGVAILVAALSMWWMTHHRERDSYVDRNAQLFDGREYTDADYPREMCDFIIEMDIPGRMFNQGNYSGYLIWRLSPETKKVFTDNRYDIFGSDFVWDELAIADGDEGDKNRASWAGLLDKYDINFIVIPRSAGLVERLRGNENWTRVYYWIPEGRDPRREGFAIYIRNTAQNQEAIARCLKRFDVIRQRRGYPAEF